jgi:peptidoglycan/LPS O-acetylase OafA/YrhL
MLRRTKHRIQQLTTGKWSELYSLRTVGVVLVIIYHFWGLADCPIIVVPVSLLRVDLTGLFRLGALGTTIVFVLAGFFNHLSFERAYLSQQPLPAYWSFLKRRLIRTLPLYYASLTATILLAGGLEFLGQPYCGTETLLSLLFLHPFVNQTCGLLGPAWAVEAVVQFYVLAPILAYLLLGKRWRVSLPIVIVVVLAYRWYIGQPELGIGWREF